MRPGAQRVESNPVQFGLIGMGRASIPAVAAAAAFILTGIGMPARIAPRHGLTHFTRVFDGGYASRYYSYLCSEVLDADAFEAFTERGDLFDPELAPRFRSDILAPGNSRDPMQSFVAFRGCAPDEGALLRERPAGVKCPLCAHGSHGMVSKVMSRCISTFRGRFRSACGLK